MLRLRHDIGNDIPPTMFSSGLSLLSFGIRSVGLFGWDYCRTVRLPMILCMVSFQLSRLLVHQFHERK
jgi:hypothetical protein